MGRGRRGPITVGGWGFGTCLWPQPWPLLLFQMAIVWKVETSYCTIPPEYPQQRPSSPPPWGHQSISSQERTLWKARELPGRVPLWSPRSGPQSPLLFPRRGAVCLNDASARLALLSVFPQSLLVAQPGCTLPLPCGSRWDVAPFSELCEGRPGSIICILSTCDIKGAQSTDFS